MHFPHPLLLCDIGGTNVRYALSAEPGAPAVFLNRAKTNAFPGLVEATRAMIGGLPIAPRSMIVCAAGPASGRLLKLTNAHWLVDGADAAVQCWAFRSTGASLANGLDIEMPNGVFYTEDKIQAAIENKTITMAVRARASVRGHSRACVRACT